jgi:hypothetical protein
MMRAKSCTKSETKDMRNSRCCTSKEDSRKRASRVLSQLKNKKSQSMMMKAGMMPTLSKLEERECNLVNLLNLVIIRTSSIMTEMQINKSKVYSNKKKLARN